MSFIQSLLYGQELELILKYFPRNQVFVYKQEDFRKDSKAFLSKIYSEVLEIDYDDSVPFSSINVGRNDKEIRNKMLVNRLNLSKKHNKLAINMTRVAYKFAGKGNAKIYTWDKFSKHQELEDLFHSQ